MKISKLSGFKESNDRQLIPIRQLDLFGQRTRIEADAALDEGTRKERLAEIDGKLTALTSEPR
jgi:phosphonate transport system substrate-binding protein